MKTITGTKSKYAHRVEYPQKGYGWFEVFNNITGAVVEKIQMSRTKTFEKCSEKAIWKVDFLNSFSATN